MDDFAIFATPLSNQSLSMWYMSEICARLTRLDRNIRHFEHSLDRSTDCVTHLLHTNV